MCAARPPGRCYSTGMWGTTGDRGDAPAPLASGATFSARARVLLAALVLCGLCLAGLVSYLLVHTLAEVFFAATAVAVLVAAWNLREFLAVELFAADQEGGGSAVRAVLGVFGQVPQPEQGMDLLRAEAVAGFDRRLAGDGRQQVVEQRLAAGEAVVLHQVIDDRGDNFMHGSAGQ